METHFRPARPISLFPRSHAIWSRLPARKLLTFAHGFRGHALDTWTRFDELLPEEPDCIGFDYIFYGYDGFRSELMASAAEFREFFKKVLTSPHELSNPSLPLQAKRSENHHYEQIIVIGHSLGAAVVRFALLDLQQLKIPNLDAVTLAFFAPAHSGAYFSRLFTQTFSTIPLFNLFAGLVKFRSPLIDQLLPDSKELHLLRVRTEQALMDAESRYMIAKDVFIATRDNIVVNVPFCQDPPGLPIDSDHISICKPMSGESPNFGHLVNIVRRGAQEAYVGRK